MKRSFLVALAIIAVMIVGCTSKKTTSNAQPSPSPAAAGAGGGAATASKPGATGTPVVQGTIPPQIPESLRRPLTHEEIMRLPPETRDMILRAQGKPVPSPTRK